MEVCIQTCRQYACEPDDHKRVGCNQKYSCVHACRIRQLGVNEPDCKNHCVRNETSGCNPEVNGFTFNLCRSCAREGCTPIVAIEECELGCNSFGGIYFKFHLHNTAVA